MCCGLWSPGGCLDEGEQLVSVESSSDTRAPGGTAEIACPERMSRFCSSLELPPARFRSSTPGVLLRDEWEHAHTDYTVPAQRHIPASLAESESDWRHYLERSTPQRLADTEQRDDRSARQRTADVPAAHHQGHRRHPQQRGVARLHRMPGRSPVLLASRLSARGTAPTRPRRLPDADETLHHARDLRGHPGCADPVQGRRLPASGCHPPAYTARLPPLRPRSRSGAAPTACTGCRLSGFGARSRSPGCGNGHAAFRHAAEAVQRRPPASLRPPGAGLRR